MKKKLIEVALPLDAINQASAREKSIRHGHPSTLHLWWARRPLAAARAVIFAQMVDDPSAHPDLFPTEEAQQKERERLFDLIARIVKEKNPKTGKIEEMVKGLVAWESTTDEKVLELARAEIRRSWARHVLGTSASSRLTDDEIGQMLQAGKMPALPAFHDPFAGGGALPLEAQRLGLEAYASDLNPVAVLINKAMIEIPPRFAGRPPVNPEARTEKSLIAREWKGAQGLADDVRHYGQWMRDEAEKRIGHLYPKVEVTAEMAKERPDLKPYVGRRLTVIAWLWARTVKSPNPAFAHVDVPLASTFMLSTKAGKEAWVEVELGAPASQPAQGGAQLAAKDGGAPDAASVHTFTPSSPPASRESSRVVTAVASPEPHRGWHSRGYLPHWDHPGVIQSLTFRLHDAVPQEVIEKWQAELALPLGAPASLPADAEAAPPAGTDAGAPGVEQRRRELRQRIAGYEDAGHGACWLRDPRIAALVENALLHFDGQRYRLIAWCIMPNHVHALIETREGWTLAGVIHSWKSFTASEANRLLGRTGPFWFREYHDRYIRHAEHCAQAVRYIEDNPVKAGLVKLATDWQFGSARRKAVRGVPASPGGPASPGAPASQPAPAGQPAADMAHRAGTDAGAPGYRFVVKTAAAHGQPPPEAKDGTSAGKRAAFTCVMSGTPLTYDYIRTEGQAGRMGARLMAIVAEGDRGRVYLPPTPEMEAVALSAKPHDVPETDLPAKALGFRVQEYGMTKWRDLFTPRQLVALTTFSDLVGEAMQQVKRDALAAGLPDDKKPLRDGGTGAAAYAEAVGVYLAFAVSKMTNIGSSIASWMSDRGAFRETFARQAIPMTWDFAEANTFADTGGSFSIAVDKGAMSIDAFPFGTSGTAAQIDAAMQTAGGGKVVSTDPPYYDNIGYADLSDFFYVWLRRSLRAVFPDLFATVAVPKTEELVATPDRHGGREKAETFFLDGMTRAMHRLADQAHPAFPVTIYYAFKQSENETNVGTASTGWETFLDAVIRAGFATSGTWPIRTEMATRMRGMDSNALASSIVLVCRPRSASAPTATRREFVAALKRELPVALAHLQRGNIAPVDLAQAAIGPGMAVYTRYSKVLDAQGKPLTVREALALINETLDEALAEQEGDFDADTRWALVWFEQQGFAEGEYGVAEQLSKSKNTSVAGMVEAGILESKRGKVRLLKPEELSADWDPATDPRLTAWEIVHHLIRALESGGEGAAAALVAKLSAKAEIARELAYRLYVVSERKKRAAEALAYNGLVQSWPEIARLSREVATEPAVRQGELI